MSGSYRITTDPPAQIVRLCLNGQWDEATVDRYRRDLADAMSRMAADGGRPGEYRLLIDLRGQGVQSKEVASACQQIISQYSSLTSRTAVVASGSALHQMQLRRIALDADRSYFASEDEAFAWLVK